MRNLLLIVPAAAFALGCARTSGDSSVAVATPEKKPAIVLPAVELPTEKGAEPISAPRQAPAVEPFHFPNDTGGKKVSATLASASPPSPALPKTTGPKTRITDLDRGEIPLPKVVATAPVIPLPVAKPPKPTPPLEGIPKDLGQAAAQNPGAVKLPEKPLIRGPAVPNPGAADVPPLGRQVPDRAALDDPTVDSSTARIINTPLPPPVLTVWFLKFTIPDPFEFRDQLQGKLPLDRELGTSVPNIPPGRP